MSEHDEVTEQGGGVAVAEANELRAAGMCVSAESYHWRMPSKPELVEKVVMQLKDRAESCGICSPERSTGLVISLTEAITNSLVHGNLEITSDVRERTDGEYGRLLARRCADPKYSGREVQIDVHWDGEVCEWVISDQGSGFDVEKLLKKLESEEPGDELASGRGVLLMKAFMDEVQYSRGGREVRLTMAREKGVDIADEDRKRIRQAVKAKGFGGGSEEGLDAVATSLSRNTIEILGIGLEHAQRLLIEVTVDGKKTLVPAKVRHVTKLASDWVQIDCRFDHVQETEQQRTDTEAQRRAIDQVLESANRAADEGHERREAARFQYSEMIRVQRKDGTTFHGVARDLSRGGLAFIGNFELERGEMLTLTLEPETANPLKVKCEVMRVQQLAGVYRDFGVRFIEGGR